MVYGGLVIVCLGTVVWGIAFASSSIFPIHWSSSEPVLDFPIDLLAYNFLMPIAIKYLRPSKGLNAIYGWWFRICAARLRLTHFMFNERRPEEEGYEVPRTTENQGPDSNDGNGDKTRVGTTIVRTGRFVRAPASDQVRLPKGSRTFIDVDENGNRLDGEPETETGLHGRDNKMFSVIYIPPNFRLRVGFFIFCLWLFAAATGVGATIIPLVFGRFIFSTLLHSPVRMNDIYSFAIGTYLLGGPLYLLISYRQTLTSLRLSVTDYIHSRNSSHLIPTILRGLRLTYFYTSFAVLLPSLLALLFEFYLLVPLHTYTSRHIQPAPTHTVHFVQDWTLSVLTFKLASRVLLAHPTTRPAQALRALVSPTNRNSSWSDPDARLATRAFILPACILMLAALSFPVGVARLATVLVPWLGRHEARSTLAYRYAYPAVLGGVVGSLGLRLLVRATIRWRGRIRDEVYLIGERLHNFGEKRPTNMGGRIAVR
jgi:E3 ubiquitin-protein ligase MARCH6